MEADRKEEESRSCKARRVTMHDVRLPHDPAGRESAGDLGVAGWAREVGEMERCAGPAWNGMTFADEPYAS